MTIENIYSNRAAAAATDMANTKPVVRQDLLNAYKGLVQQSNILWEMETEEGGKEAGLNFFDHQAHDVYLRMNKAEREIADQL